MVGAGAVGVSVGYELSRRGATVQILEAGPRPANGCSFANAGLLVPSHVEPLANPGNIRAGLRYILDSASPFYLAPRPAVVPWLLRFMMAATTAKLAEGTRHLRTLAVESLQMHTDYAGSGMETGFRRSGMLDVFYSREKLRAAERGVLNAASGLDVRSLDGHQARQLEPALDGSVAGAIHFPQEGYCDSRRYVDALASAAKAEGAVIRTGVSVERLRVAGRRVVGVETTEGVVPAGNVVIAAGIWSKTLAARAGIKIPMEAGTGYVLDIERGRSDPQIPVAIAEHKIVATPYPDRLRLSGTLELSGMYPRMNQKRIDTIIRTAATLLPDICDRRIRMVWSGQRPCTPDGLPAVGRTSRYDNLSFATGHGQSGLVLAPATARQVAEEIITGCDETPLNPFSPDRFALFNREEARKTLSTR